MKTWTLAVVSLLAGAATACSILPYKKKPHFLAEYKRLKQEVDDCQSRYLARLFVVRKAFSICRGETERECQLEVADLWEKALNEVHECRRSSIAACTEIAIRCNADGLSSKKLRECDIELSKMAESGADPDDALRSTYEDHMDIVKDIREGEKKSPTL